MKIAVWHNLSSGGAKRALYDQLRWLAAHGHQLHVWCPPSVDFGFLPLDGLATEHVLPLGEPRVLDSFSRVYKAVGAKAHMLAKLGALLPHAEAVARDIDTWGPDIVLCHPCQWLSVAHVSLFLESPRVMYLQEPYRFLYEAAPRLPWPEEDEHDARPGGTLKSIKHFLGSAVRLRPSRLIARAERQAIGAYNRVLVNSRFSRESVLRAYGIDARVCLLGIDADRFVRSDVPRVPTVLSVGQLHALKNPEFVIRAVGGTKTRPTLRWICNVVHDHTYLQHLETLAKNEGVTLVVDVAASDEAVVKAYQESAALLYAPRLEPFGFAPLEANACGCPVVAVAEGGVRETVEDDVNGLLVDTPEEMAAAIDRLVEQPGLALALGRRGARIVRERWTLDAAGQRLAQHLGEVVATAGAPLELIDRKAG